MTSCDSHPSAERVGRLLRLAPDPDRATRLRARCRTRLERGRRRSVHVARMAGVASRLLAPLVVGGFCVFYVLALVATTLRLQGVFR